MALMILDVACAGREANSCTMSIPVNYAFLHEPVFTNPTIKLNNGVPQVQVTIGNRNGVSQAVVAYDHARHALLGDVITLDFFNADLEPGARAAVELTLETARELRAALDRAIAAAEFEEAEVRGKGAVPSLVRAA